MQEIWKKARERVHTKCKVCPHCNGVACAGDLPGLGGIGTATSFQNNVKALAAKRLVMRVLHDANEPDCSCELWGQKLALPVLAAPIGTINTNYGSGMPDEVYFESLLTNCIEAGSLACIGDMPDIGNIQSKLTQAGARARSLITFLKPWVVDEIYRRLEVIAASECYICGADIDSANLPLMRRLAAPVRVWTPKDLDAVVKRAHSLGLKFIAKGLMTADEAILAADAGVDGIVVSNHGGRVLDYLPGSLEALPDIAEAVGNRVVVMLDGGLRSGGDVLKALALGAKITLICRPVALAVHGDEEHGLAKYFAHIKDELSQAMRLTGCRNLAAASPRIVC